MLIDKIISLAHQRGVIRAADLEELGGSRTLLALAARFFLPDPVPLAQTRRQPTGPLYFL